MKFVNRSEELSALNKSYMEDKFQWHGKPPSKEQAEIALQELVEKDFKMRGLKPKDVDEIMKKATLDIKGD